MTHLYELHRLIAVAVDPVADDDVTQMLGCYPTYDEADLAFDAYLDRYPSSLLYIV